MGKKRFNDKGRRGVEGNKKTKKSGGEDGGAIVTTTVPIDSSSFAEGKYDESNPLVIIPKKKKDKKEGGLRRASSSSTDNNRKLLTKKQRKKLQQIVERKDKKANRAQLLEELQKYQLPQETFQKFTPLVQVQTEGLKKLFSQIEKDKAEEDERERRKRKRIEDEGDEGPSVFDSVTPAVVQPTMKKGRSSIKGANRRNKQNQNQLKYRSWSGRFGVKCVNRKDDQKVLGFEESSSSEDDEAEVKQEDTPLVEVKHEPSESDEGIGDDDEVQVIENGNSASTNGQTDHQPNNNVHGPPPKKVEVNANPVSRERKICVPVFRTPEIEAVRSKLPIIPEEQVIMEAITENEVTVLAGETGSGKTTQVPQFLYEAGYALNGKLIGVTEPRRVAAISMSIRVAKELNVTNDVVSYQIRFEGNVSPKTQIKFMTDGVLLKEMEKDFLLSKYSAICVDEAHERSLYTDLLIGLLSRCVRIRKKRNNPLKLIIMSATMRVEDFVENPVLFRIPPSFIHVPTRQFPVQIHFSKYTPENYLVAAYKKAVNIHKKLPPGGILIFLTGQQEVRTLVKKLRKVFPARVEDKQDEDNDEEEMATKDKRLKKKRTKAKPQPTIKLRTFDLNKLQTLPLQSKEEEQDEDDDLDESGDESDSVWGDIDVSGVKEPLHVLPLYSMLPSKEQQRVFEPPPEGTRLCVVSTNVAETSLTIPSVRYVVDCGKVKLKVWDKLTGVQQFQVCWESKASAEQRSGRAGRTGPGHCYRLFSSAVFSDEFPEYSKPEIQVRPVDDMMLLMKSMAIDRVQNFPYPSPPAAEQLFAGEKTLVSLGALEQFSAAQRNLGQRLKSPTTDNTFITELGKTMSHFPLGPRFSKMLALSFQHSLVEYTIALVSALTVQEVFLDASLHETVKEAKSAWSVLRRKWAGTGSSFLLGDCMVLLRAVGAYEYAGASPEFCLKSGLRYKAMTEIRKLRKQLTSEVNLLVSEGQEVPLTPYMEPPTDEQATQLRQIILSGLPDRVARRILESELKDGEDPKVFKHAYRCGELEDPVFLHTSSVLRTSKPDWVVYQEIFESNGKMYLRGVTAIDPHWIPTFCKTLCNFKDPLQDPPPSYDEAKGIVNCSVKPSYGKQGWELPIVQVEYPHSLDKFKLFAQFLLEGKVFPLLQTWRDKLLSMPITMTKPWAKLQPRTQTMLSALAKNEIGSRAALEKKWEEDDRFLLTEYVQWVPEDYHTQISSQWPPISSF